MNEDITTGYLDVPGATLRYLIRGQGPLLFVVPGGHLDAEGSDGIVAHLTGSYTVVSYDRRGLSGSGLSGSGLSGSGLPGSGLSGPVQPVSIAAHADDLHRLVAGLASGPVSLFGSSIGALICLELVSRWNEQAAILIAHEPPAPEVLPGPRREQAIAEQRGIAEALAAGGVPAAVSKFRAMAGIDPADSEPGAVHAPGPAELANLAFFLNRDEPAVRAYRLPVAGLRRAATTIIPAAGESSKHLWIHDCARSLADVLGVPCAISPGGHYGPVYRPRAFAAFIKDTMATA